MAMISGLSPLDQSNDETRQSTIARNFNHKLGLTEKENVGKVVSPFVTMDINVNSEFDKQFPALHGEIFEKHKSDVMNWVKTLAPNRDRAYGAELQFIAPVEKDGTKIVRFEESDVAQEMQRKWGKYGEIKMFLLKTGVYVIEFKDIETETKVTEAGPSFDTSPMIVKSWTIEDNLEKEDLVEVLGQLIC
ncbi:hypothetical protein LguiA_004740 [Lonicera macranthoides]